METKQSKFETTCQLFIDSVNNYFEHLTKTPAEAGVPYLKEQNNLMLKEFTGMIGISGSRKGFVYISGNQQMYADLIELFVGLGEPSVEDVLDMAGEISNVVAGNVRETYGSDFMISVPIVFEGRPKQLKFPSSIPVFVIPVTWKSHEAFVVIGLE